MASPTLSPPPRPSTETSPSTGLAAETNLGIDPDTAQIWAFDAWPIALSRKPSRPPPVVSPSPLDPIPDSEQPSVSPSSITLPATHSFTTLQVSTKHRHNRLSRPGPKIWRRTHRRSPTTALQDQIAHRGFPRPLSSRQPPRTVLPKRL